ncbi:hypothetical protein ACFFJT_18600 [Dyella flava]|uniref:4-vinyl reductase 4VR domain-containing protein n=1 Tax=Dyella flava TaxID=1920170 RepID=A0ABS2K814_9GAMM|nr:hypothetical protein [Dyella flava]MBM7127301.1 hypothetical protein [Dyella flava]GLQ52116.1 hypothetical protein GCM10010872_35650 [Dyella flava]
MIELEVQALSAAREGLVIDIGRSVVASGFVLHRQRLVQDPNGVLVTLVVRGPARKQRALETALEANERIISFEVSPFEDGPPKPHFAAARTFAREPVPPAPVPAIETPVATAPVAIASPAPVETPKAVVVPATSEPQPEPDSDFAFLLEPKHVAPPAPAPVPVEPYVETIPLGPDESVVEKLLPRLQYDYPKIMPVLQKLEQSVVDAARESSLLLAGQRTGAWVFGRDYATKTKLGLDEAIKHLGVPALGAVVEVEYKGEGLHIRHSPLCAPGGHSGCKFFSGFLEGLLGPAVSSGNLSIFEVCCRSYGADECVLAISD